MNTIEAITNRRSIRKFFTTPLDMDTLSRILEAGMLAPSAKNRQPWKFVVTANEHKKKMLKVIKKGFENRKFTAAGMFKEFEQLIAGAEQSLRIMEEAPVTVFVINTENKLTFTPNGQFSETANTQSIEEKFSEMSNIQSIGAAVENMLLAAHEYGVGGLWICDICFAYHELCEWLHTDRQLIAAVSLGYANENPPPRPRKSGSVLIEWRT